MKPAAARIIGRSGLARLGARCRRDGLKVGLCNGAFDLLHVGHVRYLRDAAARCHVLVVAVNSDASVRHSKGPERPIIPQLERLEMVAALSGVYAVHLFEEPTVAEVICALRPHYHFKGTDYTATSVPEAALVRDLGGKVVIVGDPKDHSTSNLVKRLGPTGTARERKP